MKRRHCLRPAAVFLLLAALPLSAADDPAALVARLTPAPGWTAPEAPRTAAGDDLFDLIDGGAELYHEYGFKRAASWQVETAARASIQIELYEMVDAPAAYGVLSLMQSGPFTAGSLGQGSLRFGYYVAFWSGPYYGSVTGAQADAATQAEVDRLAAQLAALLPRDGALPAWFGRLPEAGLQTRRYFRGRIGLSNIPAGPAAELFAPKEGLCATYPGVQLLLLHYPDAAAAAAQLARAPELGLVATDSGLTRTEADGSRTIVQSRGEDLFVFSFTDEVRFRAVADGAR